MLKVRLMGTEKDMKWFHRLLERNKEVKVLCVSDLYSNKGTNKYFRMYAEVERIGGYDEDKEFKSL